MNGQIFDLKIDKIENDKHCFLAKNEKCFELAFRNTISCVLWFCNLVYISLYDILLSKL